MHRAGKPGGYGTKSEQRFWLEMPILPPVFWSKSAEMEEKKGVERKIELSGVSKPQKIKGLVLRLNTRRQRARGTRLAWED